MIFKRRKTAEPKELLPKEIERSPEKGVDKWLGNWNGKGSFLKFESEKQLLPFTIGVNGRFKNINTPAYVRSLQSIGICVHQRKANKSINLWIMGEPGTHSKTKDKFIGDNTLLIDYKSLIKLDGMSSEKEYDDLFPDTLNRLEPLPEPIFKRTIKRNRPHIQIRNDLYECRCVVCRGKFETTHPSRLTCSKCV